MSESSIPEGTETLTKGQALDHLLSTPAPEEASEILQEPVAEAETQVEAEAPLVEEVESDDAVEPSEEETEEADVEYEATEDDDEQPEEAFEESDDVEEYYTVKIDGEEKQVTADELVKNYQLEQAAQRRMQEAASERKQAEAERQVIAQQREQYEQAAKVQQEQMRVQQEKQQEMVQAHQQHLAQEQQRLLERIPEWRDEEVATREKQQVIQYAQRIGFTEQELQTASDSRAIETLRKAYLYDELMAKKPAAQKKVRKAPKVTKSGKPTPKSEMTAKRKSQAFDRLKKSGSKEAAVEYLLERNR